MVDAVLCLALVIHHEARGETETGKRAVAEVVLNRVASPNYPDTICGVVFEPHQFSHIKRSLKADVKPQLALARKLLRGDLPRVLPRGTTHYHNKSVSPTWAAVMKVVTQIGNHVFYRRS